MDREAVKFFFITLLTFRFGDTFNITVQQGDVKYCYSVENSGGRLLCGSLGEAITFSLNLSVESTTNDPPEIQLPRGTHFINGQTNFGGRSFVVQGLGEDVEVVCSYLADPGEFNSGEIHTWFFNQSRRVSVRNVNFQDCGFPLSFFAVRNVEVQNCRFK